MPWPLRRAVRAARAVHDAEVQCPTCGATVPWARATLHAWAEHRVCIPSDPDLIDRYFRGPMVPAWHFEPPGTAPIPPTSPRRLARWERDRQRQAKARARRAQRRATA